MTILLLKNNIKKRYIALMTIVLIGIVISDYFFTYQEYMGFVGTLNSNAKDVDYDIVRNVINSYSGLTYFFRFIFLDESIVFFILVFSVCSIRFFGVRVIDDFSSGQGNLIISRTTYKNYITSILKSQTIFNIMYLFVFFTFLFFMSYFIGGKFDLTNEIYTGYKMDQVFHNILAYYLVVSIKIIFLGVIVSLITSLSTLSYVLIKNKYVIQLFPLVYYFMTLAISKVVYSFSERVGKIVTYFVLDLQISNIMKDTLSVYNIEFLSIVVFILGLLAVNIFLYKKNIHTFGKDYIL